MMSEPLRTSSIGILLAGHTLSRYGSHQNNCNALPELPSWVFFFSPFLNFDAAALAPIAAVNCLSILDLCL